MNKEAAVQKTKYLFVLAVGIAIASAGAYVKFLQMEVVRKDEQIVRMTNQLNEAVREIEEQGAEKTNAPR
jgi:hypothetical protein